MTARTRVDVLLNAWRALETLPLRGRRRVEEAISADLLRTLSTITDRQERLLAVRAIVLEDARQKEREQIRRDPVAALRALGVAVPPIRRGR